ncbi:MAG: hypothetical protein WCY86_09525, partial [Spirosomataceae bacterium]
VILRLSKDTPTTHAILSPTVILRLSKDAPTTQCHPEALEGCSNGPSTLQKPQRKPFQEP